MLISASDLRADLVSGVVEIRFIKLDGTPRVARGTLNKQRIPQEQHAAADTARNNKDKTHVTFWDVNKQAWRSCVTERIQSAQLPPTT